MRHTPGKGWKRLSCAVWEHTSGIRAHIYGLVRTPAGDVINGRAFPESIALDWFIALNGGNRRRGVLAWARNQKEI